jgi:hypothetical protein
MLTKPISYKRRRSRNRKEVVVPAHRFVVLIESQLDYPQHRHGLLGHGSGLSRAC